MKLITADDGRILQLVAADEIRPIAGIAMPTLLSKFVERYQFLGRPTNYIEAVRNAVKYNDGQFVVVDGTVVAIKEFAIYRDGFMVSCQTTSLADAVVDDVWRMLFELGFRKPITERPKIYTSAVIVEFDRQVNEAIRGFEKISRMIPKLMEKTLGKTIETHLTKFTFQSDPQLLPPYTNTEFYFERRVDVPYSQNCFFAAAPLRTEEHLAFLEEFERAALREEA